MDKTGAQRLSYYPLEATSHGYLLKFTSTRVRVFGST